MNHDNIIFLFPSKYDNNQKGLFFEKFVASLIEPMRYKVISRVRYTGMEIDLLAKGCDQPKTVYIECKALKENISAEVISKLVGNIWIQNAEEGWLFSTSDLSKDAKGINENIKQDKSKAQKFTWYGPHKILEILLSQKNVINPECILNKYSIKNYGDFTLLILPDKYVWFLEILENGIPSKCILFDAKTGETIDKETSLKIKEMHSEFKSLNLYDINYSIQNNSKDVITQNIAKVMSGDSWDDLRPAKPKDFVGRDVLIQDIANFINTVQYKKTETRNFAIIGPSGWGKSSLVLKISDLSNNRKYKNCSITAIDTRSATNLSFVNEAILTSLKDAQNKNLIPPLYNLTIDNTLKPLSSQNVLTALDYINNSKSLIVLIFDQFEELFYKEELIDIFNKIKELSLDIDATQLPILLGFAWKTDVTLPQEHPAYHLWHILEDRRKKFTITEFGRKDILNLINKAEKETKITLTKALKDRLTEQCQGLPWLLKKLIVHTIKKIKDNESQYMLLDRELDLEELFKEDLSLLNSNQVEAIEYIAKKSPIPISEAEKLFNRDDLIALVNRKLILVSGLNYVIYWDIFRDYIKEKKVPYIPWNKIFQKEPKSCVNLIKVLSDKKSYNVNNLADIVGIKKGTLYNILNDLLSLQLIDQMAPETYKISKIIDDFENVKIARLIQKQLKKHIVYKKLKDFWDEDKQYTFDDFDKLFENAIPQTTFFSDKTKRIYAIRFIRWLYFAGLIDIKNNNIIFSLKGYELGRNLRLNNSCLSQKGSQVFFRAASSPKDLLNFIKYLYKEKTYTANLKIFTKGVLEDARALNIIKTTNNKTIILSNDVIKNINSVERYIKEKIGKSEAINKFIASCKNIDNSKDFKSKSLINNFLNSVNPNWKYSSAKRVWGGLKIYYLWLKYDLIETRGHKLSIDDFD